MKTLKTPVGTAGPAVRHIFAFGVAAALISMSGCVTVGYDFIRQQATVSFDAKTVKEPSK